MTSRIAQALAPIKASATPLSAGSRIECFEVEHLIAQSPRSAIYRALDRESGQVVALKEYLPNGLAARNAKGRVSARSHACAWRYELGRTVFCDEAMQLMRLRHPSLLAVLDLRQVNGTAYRVMRFEPGPTLFAHRRALAGAPAEEDVARWLDGLLGALDVLHRAGLVHGDVTPDNILLRPGERALLLDFGAVQRALAQPGAQAKEPCSRPRDSPWPAAADPPSVESDRVALALTMHYALTGRLPPPAETLVASWQRQYPGPPLPEHMAARLAALDAPLAAGRSAVPAPAPPAPPAVIVEPLPFDPAPKPAAATRAIDAAPLPEPEPAPESAPPQVEPAAPAVPAAPTEAAAVTAITPRAAWSSVAAVALLFGLALWSMKRDAPSSASAPSARAPLFAPATSILSPLPPAPRLPPLAELSTVAMVPALQPLREPPLIAEMPPPPKPPRRRASPPPTTRQAAAPSSPRQACGDRTGFALYRCMQLRCAAATWTDHAQCVRLRRSDAVE